MNDSDLARLLQEEYDREVAVSLEEEVTGTQKNGSASLFKNNNKYDVQDNDNNRQNLKAKSKSTSTSPWLSPVDPSLEMSDPNPDIRLMFLQFNEQFFWSALAGIEVKWSPRMTLCAGLCVYEGRGGLCSVRLSQPLLKLRPRKDLVETLLHEMIHAYLFVTNNDTDHSDHGPNFLSHMHRINKATGASISVYHTFHDEVESYLQHWWRCNGPCQKRAPYYGYVKRSMNRAPSPRDLWWADHQASCGGVYTKIKEPEGYGQKKTGKGKVVEGKPFDAPRDIRTFWGQGHKLGTFSNALKTTNNPSVSKEITSTYSNNEMGGSTGSVISNQLTSKTSFVGVARNIASKHDSMFSVIKSTTRSSTNSSVNGHAESLTDTTFRQRAPDNLTSKQSELSNSYINTEISDISKKVQNDSLLNRPSRNFTDHDDIIDLTFNDINSVCPETRIVEKHKRKILNQVVRGKNLLTKRKGLKNSPRVINKKVVFPKNFVSVCEGGDFPNPPPLKKTKKKYILDELDSNDGLWDESEESIGNVNLKEPFGNDKEKTNANISLYHGNTPTERIDNIGLNAHVDTSVENKSEERSLPDLNIQNNDWSCINESNVKTFVKTVYGSVKSVDKSRGFQTTLNTTPEHFGSSSQSAVGENKAGRFVGEGQKLGIAKGGTSFLSQIRKQWLKESSGLSGEKYPTPSQFHQTGVRSPLGARKRTSAEAFDEQDSDIDVQSDRVERLSKVTAQNVSSIEMSNVPQESVHEISNAANHSRTMDPRDMVSCPSCTVMVSMSEINAHLDICLLSD